VGQTESTQVARRSPPREPLGGPTMVFSTLAPTETVTAAKALARQFAEPDRTVVLTGSGASEPLFWHVPAGRDVGTVEPDLVLTLVHNQFTASARLMMATAKSVVLITGSREEDRVQSLRLMQLMVTRSSLSHVEVAVVADGPQAARAATGDLLSMARNRFGNRTGWRHVPAHRIRSVGHGEEEGRMSSDRPRTVTLTEAEMRAKEWEESFRRAERLLRDAQETLQRHLAKSGEQIDLAAPAEEPGSQASPSA